MSQSTNHRIVPLAQLNKEQIKDLADLHLRVMHSLLTDLGLPFLERYYQIASGDSSVIGACALDADENLLGWAMGSPNPNQLNGRLRESLAWFILRLMRVMLINPKVIGQVLASVRSTSTVMKPGTIELTYIGVDESVRKHGLGRELLNIFIAMSREKKYSSVELSVEADNAAAIALYTRLGFGITRSFKEGAFNRHRMELTLK